MTGHKGQIQDGKTSSFQLFFTAVNFLFWLHLIATPV